MGTHYVDRHVYPFIPEFLKWAHLSLNLNTSMVANRGLIKKNNH